MIGSSNIKSKMARVLLDIGSKYPYIVKSLEDSFKLQIIQKERFLVLSFCSINAEDKNIQSSEIEINKQTLILRN